MAGIVWLVVVSGASAQPPHKLTLRVVVAHGGVVAGASGRLHCAATCSTSVGRGALVTLAASPGPDFSFDHWSGACVGSVPECILSLDAPATVRAIFIRKPGVIGVSVGGPGSVVGFAADGQTELNCGAAGTNCQTAWDSGTTLSLLAVATSGGVFVNCGGTCAAVHTNLCTVEVGAATEVSAVFRSASPATGSQTLTVTRSGADASVGSVRSTPPGIDCPPTCDAQFPSGTAVILASPVLAGQTWTGGCVGQEGSCELIVDGPQGVVAETPPPTTTTETTTTTSQLFGVNVTVSGRGVVTGSGIRCGGPTQTLFGCRTQSAGTIALTASAIARSRFIGWRLSCSGRRSVCHVAVFDTVSVVAVFSAR